MNGLFSSWFASLFHDILMTDEDCFLKHNDIFTERGRFILRIAIVDDISEERTTLSKRLKYQFEIRNIQADLLEYKNGEEFLAASEKQPFSVVFLDIYMDRLNGIDTAKELRRHDMNCLLIFTTTSTDHALEGFQVRAMHYLVKPYAEEELSLLIDEILSRVPKPEKYIEALINGTNVQIPFREILYAEHFSHMIHIHTNSKKTLITRQSFANFTAPLKTETQFFVCNRGVIVNLAHAVDFDGHSFILNNGENISVSRKLIKDARQAFMDFLFQRRDA